MWVIHTCIGTFLCRSVHNYNMKWPKLIESFVWNSNIRQWILFPPWTVTLFLQIQLPESLATLDMIEQMETIMKKI